MRNWSVIVAIVLVGVLSSALTAHLLRRPSTEPTIIRDTTIIVKVDTIRITEPKLVHQFVTDTILVHVADTLIMRDSVWLSLPMTTKLYQDSLYRAQISGYEASLDFIEVFPRTITMHSVERVFEPSKKRRWGVGVQAGYGVSKDGFSPYVGVGISYNLIQF